MRKPRSGHAGYKKIFKNNDFYKIIIEEPYKIPESETQTIRVTGNITLKNDIIGRFELFYTEKYLHEAGRSGRTGRSGKFTTKETGTGLGLSIAYFIITEEHGGTMEVTSSQGKGTRFTIRLPLE